MLEAGVQVLHDTVCYKHYCTPCSVSFLKAKSTWYMVSLNGKGNFNPTLVTINENRTELGLFIVQLAAIIMSYLLDQEGTLDTNMIF